MLLHLCLLILYASLMMLGTGFIYACLPQQRQGFYSQASQVVTRNDKWEIQASNIAPTCLYWFNSRCETLTFVSAPYSTWIFSSVRLFSTSLTSCPSLSLSDSCVMSLEVLPKRNCSNTTWISVNVKSERLLHVSNFDNNVTTVQHMLKIKDNKS